MLINNFTIRCSKIDYQDLKLADRSIELRIKDVEADEIINELNNHGFPVYKQEYIDDKERELIDGEIATSEVIIELQYEIDNLKSEIIEKDKLIEVFGNENQRLEKELRYKFSELF